MLASGLTLPLACRAENDLAAKIKAAYLFHLTKFVEWPSLPADSLRICIAGKDDVGRMLGELANRRIKERALQIETDTPANFAACQMLFITRSEKKWADILERLNGKSVLTVSDLDDFARHGGMVGFYSEAGKIKLEINPLAASNAHLKISSKLMELARTVPSLPE